MEDVSIVCVLFRLINSLHAAASVFACTYKSIYVSARVCLFHCVSYLKYVLTEVHNAFVFPNNPISCASKVTPF